MVQKFEHEIQIRENEVYRLINKPRSTSLKQIIDDAERVDELHGEIRYFRKQKIDLINKKV